MMTTLDGFPVPIAVAGPEKGVVVVLVGDGQRPPAAYDAVCDRLHTAGLRTVVVGFDPRLTPKSVVGILDAVGIGWAVVVCDEHCPPVEIGTTVLVSSAATRAVARESQRFVYSEYRVVDLGRRTVQESTAQLAAEIVLRTSAW
jgi:hypothetical protein